MNRKKAKEKAQEEMKGQQHTNNTGETKMDEIREAHIKCSKVSSVIARWKRGKLSHPEAIEEVRQIIQ